MPTCIWTSGRSARSCSTPGRSTTPRSRAGSACRRPCSSACRFTRRSTGAAAGIQPTRLPGLPCGKAPHHRPAGMGCGGRRSVRKHAPDQRAQRGLLLLTVHPDQEVPFGAARQGEIALPEAGAAPPARSPRPANAVAKEIARMHDEPIGRVLEHGELREAVDGRVEAVALARVALVVALKARWIAAEDPKYWLSIRVPAQPSSSTRSGCERDSPETRQRSPPTSWQAAPTSVGSAPGRPSSASADAPRRLRPTPSAVAAPRL